uniref:ATP-dependent DNA helicase n=1 Tax=Heligmosomoides polygyrus TaxID=6339 RepID=A0A183G3N6_HELPZ
MKSFLMQLKRLDFSMTTITSKKVFWKLLTFKRQLLCEVSSPAYCVIISNANTLWNEFCGVMADDFLHRGFTREQSAVFAYFDIANRMADLGKHLQDFVEATQDERPEIPKVPVNDKAHAAEGAAQYETLNEGQKTQLTLFSQRSIDKRIAASLWIAQEGQARRRTVHSAFKLIIADQNRSSSMRRQQREVRMLMETEIIIWDEISMASKAAFEAVDALLCDLMQNDSPFGGKLIVVGGDFRQTLPMHGGREETLEACVCRSSLWPLFAKYRLTANMRPSDAGEDWQEFLLKVGNGEANDAETVE